MLISPFICTFFSLQCNEFGNFRQRSVHQYSVHSVAISFSLKMLQPGVCELCSLLAIFTKLGRNDPYIALFNNCSSGSGPLHIKVTQAKTDFQDENFKKDLV